MKVFLNKKSFKYTVIVEVNCDTFSGIASLALWLDTAQKEFPPVQIKDLRKIRKNKLIKTTLVPSLTCK